MSPNRLRNEGYEYKCDVWSFGLTLIYLATGSVPIASQEEYSNLVLNDEISFAERVITNTDISDELKDLIQQT